MIRIPRQAATKVTSPSPFPSAGAHRERRRPCPKPRRSGGRTRAFTLVGVLLILALVTVLVVGTTMLSQIERRAAANAAKTETARQNALFALTTAIGQLQKETGPDQRVTARAEILDSDAASATIDGVNQPYWTGAWVTGNASLDRVNTGTPQRVTSLGAANPTASDKAQAAIWLVSNPGNSAPQISPLTFAGVSSGSSRDAVVIARNYGRVASVSTVTVPLVELKKPMGNQTVTAGAYAYWVSDEGVKAKVNSPAPTLVAPGPVERQLHHLASQAAAPHKGILGSVNQTDLRATASEDLAKVSTLASLQRVPGVAAGSLSGNKSSLLAADATSCSAGVLADVRRGGLRKDLTAAFENGSAYAALSNDYGYGAGMLYRSATSAGLSVPPIDTGVSPPTDGLHWFSLYSFYNSYKGQMPVPTPGLTRSSITPTSNGNPAVLPGVVSQRVISLNVSSNGTSIAKLGALMPVPIAYRVDIALSSYFQAGLWRLRLHYYPQLVLWNPYSVQLQFNNYQFQRNVGAFATAGTRTSINVAVGGSPVLLPTPFDDPYDNAPAFAANAIVLNQETEYRGRLQLRTAAGACNVLEPGETRVFALNQDVPRTSILAAHTFTDLVSDADMSADFSQTTDLPGFSGTTDGNATINVLISQLRLRCAFIDTYALPDGLKWPWNDGAVTNIATRYSGSGGWETAAASKTWPSGLQIQSLNGAPRRIIGFYVRTKGLATSSSNRTYSNATTKVPLFSGNAASASPIDDNFSFVWQEVYLSPLGDNYLSGETDVLLDDAAPWETSFGNESAGVAAAPGTRVVLRDVPRIPMLSLGQFSHMSSANFRSIGVYEQLVFGSMFVGGSYASPIIQTDRTALSLGIGTAGGNIPNSKLFLDDSFLANEALFDRFFFSTVPPKDLNAPATTYPPYWSDFNRANSGTTLSDASTPLLNTRMKPYPANGAPPLLEDLRDVNKAAANLLLDGAFNINSTSVEAWKAVLAGVSGGQLELFDATARKAVTMNPSTGTLISRFWSASGNATANIPGSRETPWSGVRLLTDIQLTDLATRIVEQVKLRGPFLSLADFLNRRLGTAGPLTRSGALQAAIDATSINSEIKSSGMPVNAAAPLEPKAPAFILENMKYSMVDFWNTALGTPGYLMQQDLVQVLAPVIAARSDTFIIRAYGEVRNPNSDVVEGKAWAEAVVQRVPEFIDPTDPAVRPPTGSAAAAVSAVKDTNRLLGRRFKVVSFRWLNESDI